MSTLDSYSFRDEKEESQFQVPQRPHSQQSFTSHTNSNNMSNASTPQQSQQSSRRQSQSAVMNDPSSSNSSHSTINGPVSSSDENGSADSAATIHQLLVSLSSALPANLSHLVPPLRLFFDKYAVLSSKYTALKTKHSTLKSGWTDLTIMKENLEREVDAVKKANAAVLSQNASAAEVERLNSDVIRLKKKCNKVQELLRKEHEEASRLRALDSSRNGGSWVGSLLLGGAHPPPKTATDIALLEAQRDISVLREELMTKINENETLHQNIWSKSLESKEREDLLSARLLEIKEALAAMEKRVQEAEKDKQQALEECNDSEETLRSKLLDAQKELENLTTQAGVFDKEQRTTVDSYEHLLLELQRVLERKTNCWEDTLRFEKEYSWANIDEETGGLVAAGFESSDHPATSTLLAGTGSSNGSTAVMGASPNSASTPAIQTSPAFSHGLFQALLEFLEETLANFQRIKSQLTSLLRYWREMKQMELTALISALAATSSPGAAAGASSPIDSAVVASLGANAKALPPDSFPQQTHSIRTQLNTLNQLLVRTEERMERFCKDLDVIRRGIERIVKWKPLQPQLNKNFASIGDNNQQPQQFHPALHQLLRSTLSPSSPAAIKDNELEAASSLPLNTLIESMLAVLENASHIFLFQIQNLESKLHPNAGLPLPNTNPAYLRMLPPVILGESHRNYMMNLHIQYANTYQLIMQAIKAVNFLPVRTGQAQPQQKESDAAATTKEFVLRHPAYQQALCLPAAWPLIFLMDALQSNPTSSAAASPTGSGSNNLKDVISAWPTSPLPFLATLQLHLTDLTSRFAVLIRHEQEVSAVGGLNAPAASSSTSALNSSSKLSNFLLSNFTTINKLVGNIPQTLTKYSALIQTKRRSFLDGNLRLLKSSSAAAGGGGALKGFKDGSRTNFLPTEITAFTNEMKTSNSNHVHQFPGQVQRRGSTLSNSTSLAVTAIKDEAMPSQAQKIASNPGGIQSMVHLRSQATHYLQQLQSAQTTSLQAASVIPHSVAHHHLQLLRSRADEYQNLKQSTADMAAQLQIEQQTARKIEGQMRQLEGQMEAQQHDLRSKQEELEAKQRAFDELSNAHQNQSEELRTTQTNLEQEQAALALLRAEVASLEEGHTRTQKEKEDSLEVLREQLLQSQDSQRTLEEQLQGLNAALAALKEELSAEKKTSEAQNLLMQRQNSKMQSLVIEMDSLRNHYIQAQSQLHSMAEQLAAAEANALAMAAAMPKKPDNEQSANSNASPEELPALVEVTFALDPLNEDALLIEFRPAPESTSAVVDAHPPATPASPPQSVSVAAAATAALDSVLNSPFPLPHVQTSNSVTSSPIAGLNDSFRRAAGAPGESSPSHSPSASQLLQSMNLCADTLLAVVGTPTADMGVQVDVQELGNTPELPGSLLREASTETAQSSATEAESNLEAPLAVEAGIGSPLQPSRATSTSTASVLRSASGDAALVVTSSNVVAPLYRAKLKVHDEIDPHDLCDDEEEEEDDGEHGPLTSSSPPSPNTAARRLNANSGPNMPFPASGQTLAAAANKLWPDEQRPPSTASVLRQHALLQRIEEQNAQLITLQQSLLTSDAKASTYFMQLQQLASLLQSTRASYEAVVEKANKSAKQVDRLREELMATKSNYETMNIELTEKVCQLTEQLAANDASSRKQQGGGLLGRR